MQSLQQLFAAACLAAAMLLPIRSADAAPYSNIYVFGDSLVDAGNVNIVAPGTAPAEYGYFPGRFTNGPDYTDLLYKASYGRYMTPSLAGGTNFAFGGARVVDNSGFSTGGDILPDLKQQVDFYAAASGGMADPNALYIVNLLGNDVFAMMSNRINGMDPTDYSMLAAAVMAEQIQRLNDMGARNILVTGVPNLGVPAAHALQAMLDAALATLDIEGELLTYSYFDLFGRILENPAQVGLPSDMDLTTSCLDARGPSPTIDCTGYFYFDGTHPTAAIHEIVAREIGRLVGIPVPEPATFVLVALGMAGAAVAGRRQRRQVAI